ncbi:hypothetical protein ACJOYG_16285 [Acinetobacter baumannii]
MISDYWKFAFGFQYNTQLYLDHKIDYHELRHYWSIHTHQLFYVRDFNSNKLLYDSIDGLVIDLARQGFKQCKLYPFDILFSATALNPHPIFEFSQHNYPVITLQNNDKVIALAQIEYEKYLEIEPIGDPREFWGIASSQRYTNQLLCMSIIELSPQQQKACNQFGQMHHWDDFIENIVKNLKQHPMAQYIYFNFKMVNNLYLDQYDEESFPLLEQPMPQPNLGFSLIHLFEQVQSSFSSLMHPHNDSSPYQNFSHEQYLQLSEYQEIIYQQFVELICYTANHLQSATSITVQQKELLNQLHLATSDLPNVVSTSRDSDQIPNTAIEMQEPSMTTLQAITSIALFLLIVFVLLYVLYWLTIQFKFVQFVLIICGAISFLYILSKK